MTPREWRTIFYALEGLGLLGIVIPWLLARAGMIDLYRVIFFVLPWVFACFLAAFAVKHIFWIRNTCPQSGKRLESNSFFRGLFVNIERCIRCEVDLKEWSFTKPSDLQS